VTTQQREESHAESKRKLRCHRCQKDEDQGQEYAVEGYKDMRGIVVMLVVEIPGGGVPVEKS
jgi:hypothetical protein